MDGTLGTASVDITASLEPLHKGLAQARTDLQSSLDGMSHDTERWGSDVGKVVQGLTDKFRNLASLFGVGFGLREIVSSIEQNQFALARLGSVLQSTGNAAGFTKDQLVRMASALESNTNFSRTAIEGAEGVLLTFTNLGHDVFPKALQASLDLASAMGTDLATAARQVGRALDDPVKGMNRLTIEGITFTAAQEKTAKALMAVGDRADADKIVLDRLNQGFGGAAAAARDTLGGALAAVGHGFEALTQDIGGSTGALNDFINALAREIDLSDQAVQWENRLPAEQSRLGKNSALASLGDQLVALRKERDALLTGGAAALEKYDVPLGQVSQALENLNTQIDAGKQKLAALVDEAGLGHAPKSAAAPAAAAAPSEAAAKAAEAAAKEQERLQASFDKTNASINLQTADYARLAEAVNKGAEATRAAEVANDIANEQARLGAGATQAMRAQIAQEITARDQAKFALDDQKKALEAYDREQQKNNQLIAQAIDAADGLTGKYKTAADQLSAMGEAIMTDDIPAMMQMQDALTGIGKELAQTGKTAKSTSDVLNLEFAQTADQLAGELVNATMSLSAADFSAQKGVGGIRKMGEYVHKTNTEMNAFSKLGMDMAKTIEKMILEITIVNPLLNELQDLLTGTPGTKPSIFSSSLFGGSSPTSPTSSSSSPMSGLMSELENAASSLFSNGSPSATQVGGAVAGGANPMDPMSMFSSMLDNPTSVLSSPQATNFLSSLSSSLPSLSSITSMFSSGGSGFMSMLMSMVGTTGGAGGYAASSGILSLLPLLGSLFDRGGSFDVSGAGGPDSQFVGFRATPGEHVTVGPQGYEPSGAKTSVTIHNHSGQDAHVTRTPNHQGGHDIMVQIGEAMAYDINTGDRVGRAIQQSFGANRVPISR
jgi:hypothetical protein